MTSRLLSAMLVALLLTTTGYATMQNRAAQRAYEHYAAAIERAEVEFAQAVEGARERYQLTLNQALRRAVRSGAAQEVEEIQAELERLEEESRTAIYTPKSVRDLEREVAGRRYEVNGGPNFFTVGADGSFTQSRGRQGNWRAVSGNELAVEVGAERVQWRVVFSDDRTHALVVLEEGRNPSFGRLMRR